MKKFLASSVLATTVLFPVLAGAEELRFPTKLTTAERVEIHKGATVNYPVVTFITSGQKVTVIDQFTNSFGQLWYRVDLGTVKGWAPASQFKKMDETEPPVPPAVEPPTGVPGIGSDVYSYTNNAEVRRGAAASYTVNAYLSFNAKVPVLATFTSPSGEIWLRVQATPAVAGWIPSSFVSTAQALDMPLYVSVDSANVRNGPSMDSDVMEAYPKGTKLTALEQQADADGDVWYKVLTPSNQNLWVHESVVSQQPVYVSPTRYVATRNTSLYSGASYQYKIKQKLGYLSTVTFIQEFTNSMGQTWLNVKTPTGVAGWVPKDELVSSKSEIKYVYGMSKAPVRRGASTNYSVNVYLKENESVIVLDELNGWLNVETSAGIRGWVDKSLTSPTSLTIRKLSAPIYEIKNGEQYLVWKKSSNYKFKYSISGNQLKLYGGLTDVETPMANVPGIESVTVQNSGAGDKIAILTFQPGHTFTIRNSKTEVSIKVMETGLLGKKILLDPGHGGKDSGAVGPTGLREKDVVLSTGLLLKRELESYGAIVYMTRSTDVFLELSQRTAIANASDYDAFISLHANANTSRTPRGTETYYNTTVNFNGVKSAAMASDIQRNLVSSIGTPSRGIKEQAFYVNRINELPSILVELAFISNRTEESLMRSDTFKKNSAIGIRKGLEQYFSNL
ncbi:N-acetylmuramoyl-L-alanine amidase [Neobacillus piezotolerans]|uniref:N-acetylmuramoyl-L-alanine amidase n=1 Tax=Neobacillus piezotolerans TaxID=2259171 RepID=A0A3D8GSY7_9BACI|nr:N-acetylmuramoyl-L-alanine amidase [Neobacillus piezotolerans]RDU37584.1 N-acetylmuramoyl-L-alanine amidase [Neobacillus piezotolerans]